MVLAGRVVGPVWNHSFEVVVHALVSLSTYMTLGHWIQTREHHHNRPWRLSILSADLAPLSHEETYIVDTYHSMWTGMRRIAASQPVRYFTAASWPTIQLPGEPTP